MHGQTHEHWKHNAPGHNVGGGIKIIASEVADKTFCYNTTNANVKDSLLHGGP